MTQLYQVHLPAHENRRHTIETRHTLVAGYTHPRFGIRSWLYVASVALDGVDPDDIESDGLVVLKAAHDSTKELPFAAASEDTDWLYSRENTVTEGTVAVADKRYLRKLALAGLKDYLLREDFDFRVQERGLLPAAVTYLGRGEITDAGSLASVARSYDDNIVTIASMSTDPLMVQFAGPDNLNRPGCIPV